MENGAAEEAPSAVWLGRVAAVMEARGDRDEAVRLYGEAAAVLTGVDRNCHIGAAVDGSSHRYNGGGKNGGVSPAANADGNVLSSSRVGGVGAGMPTAMGGRGGGGGCSGGVGMNNLFPYSARAHYLASMIERNYRRHFNRWSRLVSQCSNMLSCTYVLCLFPLSQL